MIYREENATTASWDNFRNLTPFVLLWTNKISFIIIDMMLIGRQTMINCFVFERWRHTVLCYAILCFATFIPTSSKGRASIAMPFWQTYKQLCDNNLVSIPYNFYSFHSFCYDLFRFRKLMSYHIFSYLKQC